MIFDLIFSILIFVGLLIFSLIWKPSRVVLKEILFNPLQDSKIRVVLDEESIETNKNNTKKEKKQDKEYVTTHA